MPDLAAKRSHHRCRRHLYSIIGNITNVLWLCMALAWPQSQQHAKIDASAMQPKLPSGASNADLSSARQASQRIRPGHASRPTPSNEAACWSVVAGPPACGLLTEAPAWTTVVCLFDSARP